MIGADARTRPPAHREQPDPYFCRTTEFGAGTLYRDVVRAPYSQFVQYLKPSNKPSETNNLVSTPRVMPQGQLARQRQMSSISRLLSRYTLLPTVNQVPKATTGNS